MTTSPITPSGGSLEAHTSAPAPATTSSTTGMASLLQPTTFLNLLVDELKYQDPLNPTSSSSFMNQIAQLSQVEQLQSVSTSSQFSEAASLLGKTVTGADSNGNVITGVVSGVSNGASGPTLQVGSNFIALSAVKSIALASAASSTSTSTTTTTTTTNSPTPA